MSSLGDITTLTVNVLAESTECLEATTSARAVVHLSLMTWAGQVLSQRSDIDEGSVAAGALVSVSVPVFFWRRVLATVRPNQLTGGYYKFVIFVFKSELAVQNVSVYPRGTSAALEMKVEMTLGYERTVAFICTAFYFRWLMRR